MRAENRMGWITALLITGALHGPADAAKPLDAMIQVRLAGGMVEGKPLVWSSSQVMLLARDGQMVSFRPGKASDFRKSSPRFYGYTSSELRRRLYAQYGSGFEVSGTGHYLVVHPQGEKDKWAQRFEDLYRSFVHYFRVRGFQVKEPEFPLIAVVFPNKQAYYQHARETGSRIPPNFLGHYSPQTNRVYLYDTSHETGGDWTQNAETIIHEATHQTAFNGGIHTRYAGTPRWVSEGLATMFEARGVWNSSRYRSQKDRINRGRLLDFQQYLKKRPELSCKHLVESDSPFQRNPAAAYAEAWALSFYLCETRPRLYSKYLATTAARPRFADYSRAERVKDFETVFGDQWKMLDVQFVRYMQKVK